MYSAAENTTEIVVTSVAERRIIAKIPIDTRVEVSFNFQFSQLNKKNKLFGSSIPMVTLLILQWTALILNSYFLNIILLLKSIYQPNNLINQLPHCLIT